MTTYEEIQAFIDEVLKIEDPAKAFLFLWKNFIREMGSQGEIAMLQTVWQKEHKNWRKDLEKIQKGREIINREITKDMIKARNKALARLCKERDI